jgi:dUTPase
MLTPVAPLRAPRARFIDRGHEYDVSAADRMAHTRGRGVAQVTVAEVSEPTELGTGVGGFGSSGGRGRRSR